MVTLAEVSILELITLIFTNASLHLPLPDYSPFCLSVPRLIEKKPRSVRLPLGNPFRLTTCLFHMFPISMSDYMLVCPFFCLSDPQILKDSKQIAKFCCVPATSASLPTVSFFFYFFVAVAIQSTNKANKAGGTCR